HCPRIRRKPAGDAGAGAAQASASMSAHATAGMAPATTTGLMPITVIPTPIIPIGAAATGAAGTRHERLRAHVRFWQGPLPKGSGPCRFQRSTDEPRMNGALSLGSGAAV